MSDKEAQEDELLALASIYDGDIFSTTEIENGQVVAGGQFAAHLDLPEPFYVKLGNATGISLLVKTVLMKPSTFEVPGFCNEYFKISFEVLVNMILEHCFSSILKKCVAIFHL